MKLNRIFELRVQEHESLDYVVIRPPMTVEFAIDRHSWASASEANFKIYNLSETTRGKIFRDRYEVWEPTRPLDVEIKLPDGTVGTNRPGNVQFYAGYEHDDLGLSLLFNGQLLYGHSTRRGPDFVTELECTDFSVNQYKSQSAQTLAAGVSKREVIESLYRDLGITGTVGPGYDEPVNNQRGLVLQGDTMQLLRDITDGKWFSDLGIPIAMNDDEVINNPAFRDISPATGLINVPVKANNLVIATMMFTPQILVGQYVNLLPLAVTSDASAVRGDYSGEYKVAGVKHNGIISGTHDAQTVTTVSLMRLLAPPVFVSLTGGSNG